MRVAGSNSYSAFQPFFGTGIGSGKLRLITQDDAGFDSSGLRDIDRALRGALRASVDIAEGLQVVRQVLGVDQGSRTFDVNVAASTTSESSLGLTVTSTAATIESTEQVNTESTSFSDENPSFDVLSTSTPSFTGVYLGGDDTLSFVVTAAGTVGTDDIQLEVFDGQGDSIETVTFSSALPAGTPVVLQNGLQLALSAGAVSGGETFDLDVFSNGSYSPTSPAFEAASTSTPTIGGTFDGSETENLTFEVSAGGTIGEDEVRIKVLDGQMLEIEELTFAASASAGTPVTLSNGLTLAFSDGLVSTGETFGITAFEPINHSIDPDTAFDDSPGFDDGFVIQDGTFDVNGVEIAVSTTDTLNDVLSRINQSSAGVTAAYDTSTETVSLVQNTAGSGSHIVLENDTSGLLAATKLTGAVESAGSDADTETALDNVAALSGVQSGTFSINGRQLSIDTSEDSLNDLLEDINSSGAGVTATLSSDGESLSIVASDDTSNIELNDGSSGFFTAVGIQTGTVEASVVEGTEDEGIDSRKAMRRITELGDNLAELLATVSGAFEENGDAVREQFRTAVRGAFETHFDPTIRNDRQTFKAFGISFDFTQPADRIVEIDRSEFDRAIRTKGDEVLKLLLTDRTRPAGDGLLAAFDNAIAGIQHAIRDGIGSDDGKLIDFTA